MDMIVHNEVDAGTEESNVADVREVPLKELILSDGSVLDVCAERAVQSLDSGEMIYTAFGNTAG